MADYRFVTAWRLAAEPAAVWDVVDDVEAWPQWWPGVVEARRLPPRDGHRRLAMRFRAALGYSLGFEADVVEEVPPHRGTALVTGELEGSGSWRLEPGADAGTVLTWTWEVRPQVRWLRLLSPVARPVFAWAHADLMRRGRDGLDARLAGLAPPPHPEPP